MGIKSQAEPINAALIGVIQNKGANQPLFFYIESPTEYHTSPIPVNSKK